MPRRNDITKILVIGSGPIVIGQSAEFDYSGTQACKALKAEGYEVVLVNSNPATIMTDPELADRTYIEPLTKEYLDEVLRIESEMLKQDARGAEVNSDHEGVLARQLMEGGPIPQLIMFRKTADGWQRSSLVGWRGLGEIESFLQQGISAGLHAQQLGTRSGHFRMARKS